ncbi:MAG: hypothetical protein NC238_10445 [Dehalobacter sp.]|nr:hypothetical protein [Dehalobacter sp.]
MSFWFTILLMYEEYPGFFSPNDNDKIWRYIDFTKFVSLLDRQALYFNRADKFPDKFEGSFSKANIDQRLIVYKGVPIASSTNILKLLQKFRKMIAINCWHLSEFESAAMWKIYLKSDEGIAIQSTFGKLKNCFNNFKDPVYIGKVNYIDYQRDWVPEGSIFYPYLHKRNSFEYEKELRVVFARFPISEDGKSIDYEKDTFGEGDFIPIDLNILIERVYVSPTAPLWFTELVTSVLKKYGFEKEIVQSSLSEGPIY